MVIHLAAVHAGIEAFAQARRLWRWPERCWTADRRLRAPGIL